MKVIRVLCVEFSDFTFGSHHLNNVIRKIVCVNIKQWKGTREPHTEQQATNIN